MTVQTTQYREQLPQLGNKIFITDGGLETSLIFLQDIDLPLFAAFPLIGSDEGTAQLETYFKPYIDLALANKTGIILDTPTWRCSHGWSDQLGYSVLDTQFFNEASVDLLQQLRDRHATDDSPMVINGAIGPQDDGYNPKNLMSIDEAESYHCHQIEVFAKTRADMVTAVTMTYVEEAIGIARAAARAEIPVAISFTTELDGRLPTGMSLREAIETTDAQTDGTPVYYMINCAHPSHFNHVLDGDESWMKRIFGIRANASCMSHAELDEATELDDGNPREFGQDYAQLRSKLNNLKVVGGCCGTDHRHIAEVCHSLGVVRGASEQQVA
ncbi:MAG: homocysteine S-methyltransferase [Gammaproteobacteria bacterium]|nr:homocysteine S-methyltransferase [Gammaproteobacteria bacterium]MCP4981848.1 homocysteine S-methyltransferase [Gammaproteobacteria bacterium]